MTKVIAVLFCVLLVMTFRLPRVAALGLPAVEFAQSGTGVARVLGAPVVSGVSPAGIDFSITAGATKLGSEGERRERLERGYVGDL